MQANMASSSMSGGNMQEMAKKAIEVAMEYKLVI